MGKSAMSYHPASGLPFTRRRLKVKTPAKDVGLIPMLKPAHCFEHPSDHAEYLKDDVLARAGPVYALMGMIRRTYGRRSGAARLLQRKHIRALDTAKPEMFMIGQKKHLGRWRDLNKAPDLLAALRKAQEAPLTQSVLVKQGAREPKLEIREFKLPPAESKDAYLFSADGGKTPLTKQAVTKMTQSIRAFRSGRTGEPEDAITTRSERVSLAYWMVMQERMEKSVAMDWLDMKNPKILEDYVAKGIVQHGTNGFFKSLPQVPL